MININNIIREEEFKLLEPFDWKTMIELGNKTSKGGHKGESYKEMFESQGIEHTSIDLNGRNGALALDLSKPINLPSADIVTNFGTSEHILDGQEQVFRNIHNLSHHRIINVVPRVNNYPHHGYWHFDLDFFQLLGELNNYQIDELKVINRPPRQLICCCYTKINKDPFIWDSSLPIHYNKTTRGTVIKYAKS